MLEALSTEIELLSQLAIYGRFGNLVLEEVIKRSTVRLLVERQPDVYMIATGMNFHGN